jgi:hypothetical protein
MSKNSTVLAIIVFLSTALNVIGIDPALPEEPPTATDRRQVSFWPEDPDTTALDDPQGCTVTMAPMSAMSERISRPCGVPFVVEPADTSYLWWLEKPGKMSPQSSTYFSSQGDQRRESKHQLAAPLFPAGTVAFDVGDEALASGGSFRVFQDNLGVEHKLTDKVTAERGVQVPVGRAVAALAEDRPEDGTVFTNLTRPFAVSPSKTTRVSPPPPSRDASHLIVRFEAQQPLENLKVILTTDESELPPAFTSLADGWAVAIWYELRHERVLVSAETDTSYVGPVEVVLSSGTIDYEVLSLVPLPKVQVDYALPDQLHGPSALRVEDLLAGSEMIREVVLERSRDSVDILNLPRSELRVILSADEWEFADRVDLTDGRDAHVAIFPDYFEIIGTVFYGEDPAPAEVAFYSETSGRWFETTTDSQGEYRLVFFEPTSLAKVRLEISGESEWLMEPLPDLIEYDTEHDFHIPSNAVRIIVEDADSGAPIEGASVTYTDVDPGKGAQSARLVTDNEGSVALPPVRYPPVQVEVLATGYVAEGRSIDLGDDEAGVEVLIRLTKIEADRGLRVLLPNGQPASGATLFLLDSISSVPIWRSACDSDGWVGIPDIDAGWFAVTHSQAGFVVRPFSSHHDPESEEIVRMPPKGNMLTLKLVDPAGNGVRQARYAIWIDGVRLVYPLTYMLMPNSRPFSDESGLIHLDGLPAGDFEIVASSLRFHEDLLAGAFDPFRQTIRAPWPSFLSVSVVK